MNPNEMTLDEIRDELARYDGYTQHARQDGYENVWYWRDAARDEVPHPHPATLDGAAAAMPDGRWIAVTRWKRCIGTDAEWQAQSGGDSALEPSVVTGGPTEILARYRLAVACRMAMKEATR